jgi:hypothetical protein
MKPIATLSYGEEIYNALKEAVKYRAKWGTPNTSMNFVDNEMKIEIMEATEEWYLIDIGYHACRIMNGLKE